MAGNQHRTVAASFQQNISAATSLAYAPPGGANGRVVPERVNCELDLDSCTIKVQGLSAFCDNSYLVTISFFNLWQDLEPHMGSVSLEIELRDSGTCYIQVAGLKIGLASQRSKDWSRFLALHFRRLIDLVLARVLLRLEHEDFLLVEPSTAGKIWVLSVMNDGDSALQGQLVERDPPPSIEINALVEAADQRRDLEELFVTFKAWLGDDFSMVSGKADVKKKLLSIKVHSDALWFLRFPVSAFCHLGYGGLAAYQDVEWIVTEKGFLQSCHERMLTERELLDLTSVMKHTVVILNEYQRHSSKLCKTGTKLVVDLLSCLQDVEFQTGNASLRWYCNPSAAQVKEILLDQQTYYFFGDFEARKGQWELGEGEYRSWDQSLPQEPRASEGLPDHRDFTFEGFDRRLQHIRLMRVFHCNSIFDPSKVPIDAREPADRHSIVRLLLDYGVQRVEGGMTEESYCDYLCSLIYLFYQAEHFRFALRFKLVEHGIHPNEMTERVNQFLRDCNRDLIGE